MTDLWTADAEAPWRAALDGYAAVVARQGVAPLAELDRWYREELPGAIADRRPAPHVTHAVLVRGNEPAAVERTSAAALAAVPHPIAPIATLAELDGVGPATASAVAA